MASTGTQCGKKHREGSGALVDRFEKEREKRGTRRYQDLKETMGDALDNSEIGFRVVSSGTHNSGKSIILHTNFTSYLFNSGDGIMRHLFENVGKWSKTEHVFITHKSAENVAGTLELNASLAETGNRHIKLHVHGSGFVDCLTNTETRRFSSDITCLVERVPHNELYVDPTLTSECIQIWDARGSDDNEKAASAFKLTFKEQKRKIDSSKLVKFAVKPGPWLKQLTEKNESVEVDGKTLHPEDLLQDRVLPEVVLVVDCPTKYHLPSLVQKKQKLSKIEDESEKFVDIVFHMTPDSVAREPEYQQWMSEFPQTTTHLTMSDEAEAVPLKYAWEQQVHLNMIDKDVFPLLYPKPMDVASSVQDAKDLPTNVLDMKPSWSYRLRPLGRRGRLMDTVRNVESAMEHFSQKEKVMEAIAARPSFADESVSREYPVVTMLGTGASLNTRTRNVAGILVETSKDNYILLDCGYGIIGQLTRLYGTEKTNQILRDLKAIFISHGHTDHHGGLLSFMSARKKAIDGSPTPDLFLFYPRKLGAWLLHLHEQFDGCMERVRAVVCGFMVKGADAPRNFKQGRNQFTNPQFPQESEMKSFYRGLGLKALTTFTVRHAYALACYGICLEGKDFKFVYSGDTLPCDELVEAALDADLLIHEATFGDSYHFDAKLKTHSTTSQALDIAKRCRAKFTLLTHFSGRYPRMPGYSEKLWLSENAGVAFDNMILRPKDLCKTTMRSLSGVLSLMYPEYADPKINVKEMVADMRKSGTSNPEIVSRLNQSVLRQQAVIAKVAKKRKHSSSGSKSPTPPPPLGGDDNSETSAATRADAAAAGI